MRVLSLIIALSASPALAADGEAPTVAADDEAARSARAEDDPVPEGKDPPGEPNASEADLESWQENRIGVGGIPAVNYNADEGFGFGVVFGVYKYNGKTAPYKWSLDNQLFMTTRNVHHHRVIFDVLDLMGGKLRILGRVKFEASRAEHYCGYGGDVTCDTDVRDAVAEDLGLTGDELDTFNARYYKMRYIMPYGIFRFRYNLRDKPHRVSIFGGWRGNYVTPGDLGEKGPWDNTYYQDDFPEGEQGLVSVLQLGIMSDNRRNEAAPYDGYWVEASVRGSTRYWGSNPDWEYFGFNTILRTYTPLIPKNDGALVFANRVAFDGIVGDTNTIDLAWSGGSGLQTYGGGVDSVRGIRARRFRGKVDLLEQMELRGRFTKFKIANIPFEFGGVIFADAGMVGEEWSDFGKTPPFFGTGGGIRLTMDQNFVIQADVGVSPVEGWGIFPYIETGNTF